MRGTTVQRELWRLVRVQHGVIARRQLLGLGYSGKAIENRIAAGRLHPLYRGVYVVGRPDVTQRGRWMAAVLSCGTGAALSHHASAALWEIGTRSGRLDVSIPLARRCRAGSIIVHRRKHFETTRRHGIPVTTPICTLVDLATCLTRDGLEAAVNEADKRGLV